MDRLSDCCRQSGIPWGRALHYAGSVKGSSAPWVLHRSAVKQRWLTCSSPHLSPAPSIINTPEQNSPSWHGRSLSCWNLHDKLNSERSTVSKTWCSNCTSQTHLLHIDVRGNKYQISQQLPPQKHTDLISLLSKLYFFLSSLSFFLIISYYWSFRTTANTSNLCL